MPIIKKKSKTHVDLFAGIGSFAFCASKLGLTTTHSVEIVKAYLDLCKDKYKSIGHEDINTFEMPETTFLLTGGFPCQDISKNNKFTKLGLKGKKSGLWSQMLRCFVEGQPKYGIIENVENLRRKGLGQVIQDLASIGYDTAYTTIDSRFCGVPQRRRRVYIVAFRDGIFRKADPLKFSERSKKKLREELEAIKRSQKEPLESSEKIKVPFKYFTYQAFDCYQELSIGSTVSKGKSVDDIIYHDSFLRRVSTKERLALQGLPRDYLEGYPLNKSQKIQATGMTIPVVKWLIERVLDYDREYG